MRGMYMKVLVILSERIATMAKLTAGIANLLSTFWGERDVEQYTLRLLECEAPVGNGCWSRELISTRNEKAKAREEKYGTHAKYFNGLLSGDLDHLFRAKAAEEEILAEVAELDSMIDILNRLILAAKKAEDSHAELVRHMSSYLKQGFTLGILFEDYLKESELATAEVKTLRDERDSAEYSWF